jgi:hypothetical protein
MLHSSQITWKHRQPKLLEQVRHTIHVRHDSLRTEETYVQWIRRFILFHNKRHPREMGAEEIQQFLTDLAVTHRVAASTQNQALSALLYGPPAANTGATLDESDAGEKPMPSPR